MIPCLTITDDQRQIAAQHLVCSYLVRACREAMYELALDDPSQSDVRREAIRLLKVIHQDWSAARRAIVEHAAKSDFHCAPIAGAS